MIEFLRMKLSLRSSLTRTLLPVMVFMLISNAFGSDYEHAHQLVTQRQWAQVLPLLKTLHDEAPSSVLIGQDYAQALLRMNRRDEAMGLFKKYGFYKEAQNAGHLFLTQETFRLYQEGLAFISNKKYSQACDRFERALEKDQSHLWIQLRLGQCKVLDGNGESAVRHLESIERLHGEQNESILWKGKALSLRGQTAEAISQLKKAIELLPRSELAPIWLSETYLVSGQRALALTVLEEDLRRNPEHTYALVSLIRVRISQPLNPTQLLDVQKQLELAKSKLPRYESPELPPSESELGLELRDPALTARAIELLRLRIRELSTKRAAS
jgi:tetratricopeptide (TPR) repeat protein